MDKVDGLHTSSLFASWLFFAIPGSFWFTLNHDCWFQNLKQNFIRHNLYGDAGCCVCGKSLQVIANMQTTNEGVMRVWVLFVHQVHPVSA